MSNGGVKWVFSQLKRKNKRFGVYHWAFLLWCSSSGFPLLLDLVPTGYGKLWTTSVQASCWLQTCVARVWCETVPHLFMCFAWHWNRGIIFISSHNPVFFPSVFCCRKMDSEKFGASVSFYPGERDNEDHQTRTRSSDNENDIIKMSRIYSETVLLLHHSTLQPSTELTG